MIEETLVYILTSRTLALIVTIGSKLEFLNGQSLLALSAYLCTEGAWAAGTTGVIGAGAPEAAYGCKR